MTLSLYYDSAISFIKLTIEGSKTQSKNLRPPFSPFELNFIAMVKVDWLIAMMIGWVIMDRRVLM